MTFQVIVSITHVKGHPPLRLTSAHDSWEEADKVFEKFHDLYKMGNNCVNFVELEEINAVRSIKKAVTNHGNVSTSTSKQAEATRTGADYVTQATEAVVSPSVLEA